MLMSIIISQAEEAIRRLKEINPEIKCKIVVAIDNAQFTLDQMSEQNIELFGSSGIFINPSERAMARYARYCELKRARDALKEKIKKKASIRAEKTISTIELKMTALEAFLRSKLKTADILPPQFELRFQDLDIDEIQRIKMHPIVQTTGKTEMSPVSIRVVIA